MSHDDVGILLLGMFGTLAALITLLGVIVTNRSNQKKEAIVIKAAADMAVTRVNDLLDRVIDIRQQIPAGGLSQLVWEVRTLTTDRAHDLENIAAHQTAQDDRLDRLESAIAVQQTEQDSRLDDLEGP